MKRLAIQSVFSDKAKTDRIKVVDQIALAQTKTRVVAGVMNNLKLVGRKCLILDEGRNESLALSCRNLPGVTYRRAALANGYELLRADIVLFTKAGLAKVEEVFA
jgi:large subunit ribosomal protein L4